MKAMSVGIFKANFSEILKQVMAGEEFGIWDEHNNEIVAKLVPNTTVEKQRRKLGILDGKAGNVCQRF